MTLMRWFGACWEGYCRAVLIGFMVVLCGTLFFGRAFSMQKLGVFAGVPLYITDFYIVFTFPFVGGVLSRMGRIPLAFRWVFGALFIFGMFYLTLGTVVHRNQFAYRGVVLATYLLFLPLVWGLWEKHFNDKVFFVVLVACNLVTIFNAWLLFSSGQLSFDGFVYDLSGVPVFNGMLYCVMTLAFLLPYGMDRAKGLERWLIGSLCGLNVFSIITSGLRSGWAAAFCLMLFYVFIFRNRVKELIFVLGIIFIVTFVLLQAQGWVGKKQLAGPVDIKSSSGQSVVADGGSPVAAYTERAAGVVLFVDKVLTEKSLSIELLKLKGVPSYDNITWRLKIWKATWEAGRSSPMWGHGFDRVLVYQDSITTTRIQGFAQDSGITPPHNEFMTIFYKMGFLGLALFLWANGFLFVQGMRAVRLAGQGWRRACLTGALGAMVGWHVMAQFYDVIDSPPTNIFIWMLLGLILVLVYGERPVREGGSL